MLITTLFSLSSHGIGLFLDYLKLFSLQLHLDILFLLPRLFISLSYLLLVLLQVLEDLSLYAMKLGVLTVLCHLQSLILNGIVDIAIVGLLVWKFNVEIGCLLQFQSIQILLLAQLEDQLVDVV